MMVLGQKVVEVYASGFIRPSKSPAGAPRKAEKGLILLEDFLLTDASIGFHLQQCRHTVYREGAHLGEFTRLQVSYLLICLSKSPSCLPTLWDYLSARMVALDYMSIPTKKGLLFRVHCVHPERFWPGPKLVRVIQMFLRLLSTSLLSPLTSMLRMSWLIRLIN